MFFREMGYEATTPRTIELAGRGRKEVDVHIRDPRASVNQIMLAECKCWASRVPQDTVHSFRSVMEGTGANTGFIISKVGFQTGAYEATQNTNIHLLTWDELQWKFGRQWYLYRYEQAEKIVAELRTIDGIFLHQFSPAPISNWMPYRSTSRTEELLELLNDMRIVGFAFLAAPKTFDTSGPIDVSVYESFPGAVHDRHRLPVLRLPDLRAFFEWIETTGTRLRQRFDLLSKQAHQSFENLTDGRDVAFAETLRMVVEELPIRSFKEALGEETFTRLIDEQLARPTKQQS